MDHGTLDALKRGHPGWRLLAADHAPLIISFFHATFILPNTRTMPQHALAARLDDVLHQARSHGGELYPRTAEQYLDIWADDEHGWLRKYYPRDGDEPLFDLTSATEKAIEWVIALKQRRFVGTESRLMMVFELLRQMTEGSEIDPRARIAELEKRRAQIDAEMSELRSGTVDLMEPVQIKDRFQQMASTARGLLSDFREVEQNFRNLDREIRERIAVWEGPKGALLESVFGERDAISDSDQGTSFRAFWDLLMSPERQEELSSMLARVLELPAVRELEPDARLLRVHYDWLEAGEITQRTIARVSEQLRRYLDDQAWLENHRIMQLIRQIEHNAIAIRNDPSQTDGFVMELDEPAPTVDLPFERPLFKPLHKPVIDDRVSEGTTDITADELYEQIYVDKSVLESHIWQMLQTRTQVSLREIVDAFPLEHGLAELVAYMSIASDDSGKAMIDDRKKETLSWDDPTRGSRQATLPLVIFTR